MSERDKVLKTLRDVPGVEVQNINGPIASFRRNVEVFVGRPDYICLTVNNVDHDDVTLAEAVAALTPPSEPKPPTYEFVAGLPGAEAGDGFVLFRNRNGRLMGFRFNAEGLIAYAVFGDEDLATPTTKAEVIATLKVCQVEVGK